MKGTWQPQQHPRSADGRFTNSPAACPPDSRPLKAPAVDDSLGLPRVEVYQAGEGPTGDESWRYRLLNVRLRPDAAEPGVFSSSSAAAFYGALDLYGELAGTPDEPVTGPCGDRHYHDEFLPDEREAATFVSEHPLKAVACRRSLGEAWGGAIRAARHAGMAPDQWMMNALDEASEGAAHLHASPQDPRPVWCDDPDLWARVQGAAARNAPSLSATEWAAAVMVGRVAGEGFSIAGPANSLEGPPPPSLAYLHQMSPEQVREDIAASEQLLFEARNRLEFQRGARQELNGDHQRASGKEKHAIKKEIEEIKSLERKIADDITEIRGDIQMLHYRLSAVNELSKRGAAV